MQTTIIVIGDTHVSNIKELPQSIIKAIEKADWVFHTGDYTRKQLIKDLILLKGEKFKGVYGNTDPYDIRELVPEKLIIEILNKRIGITHPASGGPSSIIRTKVLSEFQQENLDILIYGHTHKPYINRIKGLLLLNPGQAYIEKYSYGATTSFIIIEIDDKIDIDQPIRVNLKYVKE